MKKHEIKELSLGSIRYVFDETAAVKWFDLYVDLMQEMLLNKSSKTVGQAYIECGGEDQIGKESSSLLPKFD